MQKLSKTVIIKAPVEEVFAFIEYTPNLIGVWPSMVELKEFRRLPNGGVFIKPVYKMAGIKFVVDSEDVEYIKNEKIVSITGGGIQSKVTWLFKPVEEGTELTFEAEFTVPLPVASYIAEAIVTKVNEKEVIYLMNNLKKVFLRSGKKDGAK